MKNKKVNVVIIAIIVVITVAIAYVVTRSILPKMQAPDAQIQPSAQQTTDSLVYVNKDFGFQLKLPANLSGYKVTISDSIGGKTKYINFYLPTNDKNWSENFLGDEHAGYARIFSIMLTPLSDWTKEAENIRKNKDNVAAYFSEETVLAKINGYAFDYYNTTSRAQDLNDISVTEEYLKANLKPVD